MRSRRRLHPHFCAALVAAPQLLGVISRQCGFTHQQRFSNLIHDKNGVPISTAPLFKKVALLIGYPSDQIFVADPPRLIKAVRVAEPVR